MQGKTGIINGVTEENKTDIFYMLCFCLCVPQSKAVKAEVAILDLRRKKYHEHSLTKKELMSAVHGRVRFANTKGFRLMQARSEFFLSEFWETLKSNYVSYREYSNKPKQQMKLLMDLRRFLIGRFNGMGFKVASHFMRNIGMSGLSILDVHIVNGMKERNLLDADFKLAPKNYEKVEQVYLDYAKFLGLTVDELDLMLWSAKTGYVFK